MAEATHQAASVRHPAPHRDRVALAELGFSLAAAPLAWGAQLVLSYGLASHVCFGGSAPRGGQAAHWTAAMSLLLATQLVALAIALIGAAMAYRLWRATRREVSDEPHEMIEAGRGRTRFLALWGLMTSLGFAGAILFGVIGSLLVPLCG
jgi:hypothetical protein